MSTKWEAREQEHNFIEKGTSLVFQTIDWYCEDTDIPDSVYKEYTIYVSGVSISGRSVCLKVTGFHPYFFIELPPKFNKGSLYSIKEALSQMFIKPNNITYHTAKRYYGFENGKLRQFLKLSFYTNKSMKNAMYKLDKEPVKIGGIGYRFEIYEGNIDPILRFTHIQDILTAGFVEVSDWIIEEDMIACHYTKVKNYSNPEYANKLSNIRIMYYDIEVCSEDGSFPNATRPNDKVTQICCIYKDSIETKKFLFNLGTIGEIDSTTVIQYPSEKKLLLGYAQFIRDIDPDIIVGYNIFGFDNGYLFERSKIHGIEDNFNKQSRLPEHTTYISTKLLDNQQSGYNDWKMTRLVGRTHIDLLQVVKKEYKFESYKLDDVCESILEQGKDDVTPFEIFDAWNPERGTREKRTRIGKYCVQDTNLCLLLFEKLAVLPNHIEMAKVTRVPLEFLIVRGQSIKVYSQIAYETRKNNFLIPTLKPDKAEEKFQGATVLEAKTGYYQRPVCGLDFASLYPSIMIAHNMCYSTIVLDEQYLNLPGIEYSTIAWETDGNKFSFTFVQSTPGILSGILKSLWEGRKAAKLDMKKAEGYMKVVFNGKQLAIKVSMNSIYGFTGATVGALPCLGISQSVTGCGRQMIEQTQNYAKNVFACEIVYGDSVTGDTPVLLKENSIISVRSIEELWEYSAKRTNPKEYSQFKWNIPGLRNKEQVVCSGDIYSWTSSGWSPIVRVIRHYTNKRIFRIITDSGSVDVTEDHSLLNVAKEQIKPKDLFIGQQLLTSYPKQTKNSSYSVTSNSKVKEAEMFLLSGNHSGLGIITEIIDLGNTEQFVYDIETEDGTFHAGTGNLIVKNTDSCYVIFPEPVDSDGTLTTLFKVASRAAKEISETFRKPIELEFEKFMYPLILVAKKRYLYLEWTQPEHHNGEIEAKGVELVRRDNCPYVKDTLNAVLTPIMFENNKELGIKAAEEHIDNLLEGKVEVKKLILSKNLKSEYKNYNKYFINGNVNDYQWIHTKKATKKDLDGGIKFYNKSINKDNKIVLKEITQTVNKGDEVTIYEDPPLGHVTLVDKMIQRDPNSAPKPGERVPFVYVDIQNPKAKNNQKTEDPKYVIENNIPTDNLYYFEHQLENPLRTLFNNIIGVKECDRLFNRKSINNAKKKEKELVEIVKKKEDKINAENRRIKEKNHDIRNFFKQVS